MIDAVPDLQGKRVAVLLLGLVLAKYASVLRWRREMEMRSKAIADKPGQEERSKWPSHRLMLPCVIKALIRESMQRNGFEFLF
jgi:hypothetical protein